MTTALWLLAHQVSHHLLDRRDARRAAHQEHVVDLPGSQVRVREGLLGQQPGLVDVVPDQPLEVGPPQVQVEDLAARREADRHLIGIGQIDLGALRGVAEALVRARLVQGLHAELGLELLGEVVGQHLVEVDAASLRSPLEVSTRRSPPSTAMIVMSKVPPPRS